MNQAKGLFRICQFFTSFPYAFFNFDITFVWTGHTFYG